MQGAPMNPILPGPNGTNLVFDWVLLFLYLTWLSEGGVIQ
jgi:hypothetical protein